MLIIGGLQVGMDKQVGILWSVDNLWTAGGHGQVSGYAVVSVDY